MEGFVIGTNLIWGKYSTSNSRLLTGHICPVRSLHKIRNLSIFSRYIPVLTSRSHHRCTHRWFKSLKFLSSHLDHVLMVDNNWGGSEIDKSHKFADLQLNTWLKHYRNCQMTRWLLYILSVCRRSLKFNQEIGPEGVDIGVKGKHGFQCLNQNNLEKW